MNHYRTRRLPLWCAMGLYLLVGWLLLPEYRFQINPDGISYINNARLILQGHFLLSVGNHWNPLISWLLAPLIALGIDAQLAFKVMNLLVGLSGFVLLEVWLDRFRIDGWLRWLGQFALIPLLFWMAISVLSPDLLVALCLLFYMTVLYSATYFDRRRHAVGLGFAAGLAYLAKYYALPFIAVHLTTVYLLEGWQRRFAGARRLLAHYALVGLVFAAIVMSWMTVQSEKYRHFDMGHHLSGWLFAFIDPHHQELPLDRAGLVELPHAGATSVWDDPHFVPIQPWKPWQSLADLGAYLQIVRGFFSYLLQLLNQFSPFALGVVLILLYFGLSKADAALPWPEAWRWLSPFLIYLAGYLFVWVEERYLWFVNLLLLLMALRLAGLLLRQKSTLAARVISGLLILSFCYFPAEKLLSYRQRDRVQWERAASLADAAIPADARVASNRNWNESLTLCYYRQWKYLGDCVPYREEAAVRQALSAFRVDFFLFWGHKPAGAFGFLEQYPDRTLGKISGIHLYDVRMLK